VDDVKDVPRPGEREGVARDEQQVGSLTPEGERKPNLRPQAWERQDHDVDAEAGARP
jgi:hypothetical protein